MSLMWSKTKMLLHRITFIETYWSDCSRGENTSLKSWCNLVRIRILFIFQNESVYCRNYCTHSYFPAVPEIEESKETRVASWCGWGKGIRNAQSPLHFSSGISLGRYFNSGWAVRAVLQTLHPPASAWISEAHSKGNWSEPGREAVWEASLGKLSMAKLQWDFQSSLQFCVGSSATWSQEGWARRNIFRYTSRVVYSIAGDFSFPFSWNLSTRWICILMLW